MMFAAARQRSDVLVTVALLIVGNCGVSHGKYYDGAGPLLFDGYPILKPEEIDIGKLFCKLLGHVPPYTNDNTLFQFQNRSSEINIAWNEHLQLVFVANDDTRPLYTTAVCQGVQSDDSIARQHGDVTAAVEVSTRTGQPLCTGTCVITKTISHSVLNNNEGLGRLSSSLIVDARVMTTVRKGSVSLKVNNVGACYFVLTVTMFGVTRSTGSVRILWAISVARRRGVVVHRGNLPMIDGDVNVGARFPTLVIPSNTAPVFGMQMRNVKADGTVLIGDVSVDQWYADDTPPPPPPRDPELFYQNNFSYVVRDAAVRYRPPLVVTSSSAGDGLDLGTTLLITMVTSSQLAHEYDTEIVDAWALPSIPTDNIHFVRAKYALPAVFSDALDRSVPRIVPQYGDEYVSEGFLISAATHTPRSTDASAALVIQPTNSNLDNRSFYSVSVRVALFDLGGRDALDQSITTLNELTTTPTTTRQVTKAGDTTSPTVTSRVTTVEVVDLNTTGIDCRCVDLSKCGGDSNEFCRTQLATNDTYCGETDRAGFAFGYFECTPCWACDLLRPGGLTRIPNDNAKCADVCPQTTVSATIGVSTTITTTTSSTFTTATSTTVQQVCETYSPPVYTMIDLPSAGLNETHRWLTDITITPSSAILVLRTNVAGLSIDAVAFTPITSVTTTQALDQLTNDPTPPPLDIKSVSPILLLHPDQCLTNNNNDDDDDDDDDNNDNFFSCDACSTTPCVCNCTAKVDALTLQPQPCTQALSSFCNTHLHVTSSTQLNGDYTLRKRLVATNNTHDNTCVEVITFESVDAGYSMVQFDNNLWFFVLNKHLVPAMSVGVDGRRDWHRFGIARANIRPQDAGPPFSLSMPGWGFDWTTSATAIKPRCIHVSIQNIELDYNDPEFVTYTVVVGERQCRSDVTVEITFQSGPAKPIVSGLTVSPSTNYTRDIKLETDQSFDVIINVISTYCWSPPPTIISFKTPPRVPFHPVVVVLPVTESELLLAWSSNITQAGGNPGYDIEWRQVFGDGSVGPISTFDFQLPNVVDTCAADGNQPTTYEYDLYVEPERSYDVRVCVKARSKPDFQRVTTLTQSIGATQLTVLPPLDGNDMYTLNWTSVANAVGYQVSVCLAETSTTCLDESDNIKTTWHLNSDKNLTTLLIRLQGARKYLVWIEAYAQGPLACNSSFYCSSDGVGGQKRFGGPSNLVFVDATIDIVPPEDVKTSVDANGLLSVMWTATSSQVSQYHVYANPEYVPTSFGCPNELGSVVTVAVIEGKTNYTAPLTNLFGTRKYMLSVTATRKASDVGGGGGGGEGGDERKYIESAPVFVEATTPTNVPDVPVIVDLKESFATVKIVWEPPCRTNGEITRYRVLLGRNKGYQNVVAISDDDCVEPNCVYVFANTTEHTFTNVSGSLLVTVAATTSKGFGGGATGFYRMSSTLDPAASQEESDPTGGFGSEGLVAIGVIIIVIVVGVLLFVGLHGNQQASLNSDLEFELNQMKLGIEELTDQVKKLFGEEFAKTIGNATDTEEKFHNLEVDRHQLILGAELGKGAFGIVCRAKLEGPLQNSHEGEVAVKMLLEGASAEELTKFLVEARLMALLVHPNLLTLLAVVTIDQPFMIVTELMTKGDLKEFLRGCRPDENGRQKENIENLDRQLFEMIYDISGALEFLEMRHVIHRDIAARNVLCSESREGILTVKLSDFGLSRNIIESDYYRKTSDDRVPVKWMAPESINERIYTNLSDVWSFGVLIWEITSLAQSPYAEYSAMEAVAAITAGFRMKKPDLCSQDLYDNLVMQCWQFKSELRPTFAQCHDILQTMRDSMGYLLPKAVMSAAVNTRQLPTLDEDGYVDDEASDEVVIERASGYQDIGDITEFINNVDADGHPIKPKNESSTDKNNSVKSNSSNKADRNPYQDIPRPILRAANSNPFDASAQTPPPRPMFSNQPSVFVRPPMQPSFANGVFPPRGIGRPPFVRPGMPIWRGPGPPPWVRGPPNVGVRGPPNVGVRGPPNVGVRGPRGGMHPPWMGNPNMMRSNNNNNNNNHNTNNSNIYEDHSHNNNNNNNGNGERERGGRGTETNRNSSGYLLIDSTNTSTPSSSSTSTSTNMSRPQLRANAVSDNQSSI